MKKGKEKYVSPQTERIQVELEQGFMRGSINPENPNNESGKIEEHQVNDDFGFSFDGNDWDNVSQQ